MDIIKLYTAILQACGCQSDKDGYVSVDPSVFTGESNPDKALPFIVNEKRVVLPTDEQLRSGGNDKIVFHPLNENILRGESDVLVKLRTAFSIRLNHLFFISVKTAIQMIYDVDSHKKFNPGQHEILSIAPDLTEDTAVDFVRMMRNATAQNPNAYVSLYLKRSGTVDNKKYSRVGVIGFPFYNELKKEQDTYYGVKLRKRDRAGIIKLMEFIFPDIDKDGAYSRGSNSQVAPFMDALMKSVLSVGSKLNDYFETYRSVISGFEEGLIISSDWVDAFENLDNNVVHIRKIPVQAGNEGSVKQEGATVVATQPVVAQQQPTYVTPPVVQAPVVQQSNGWVQPHQLQQPVMQQPAPAPVNSNGKVSFANIASSVAPAAIPPSMMMSDPRMATQYAQMQAYQQQQQYQRSNGARASSYPTSGFNPQYQPQQQFQQQPMGGFPMGGMNTGFVPGRI